MKILLWIIGIMIALVTGFYAFNRYIYPHTKDFDEGVYQEKQEDESIVADYKDGRYLIDGEFVQLTDGVSRVPAASDSASEIVTQYFGNEVRADFDQDGDEDIAFLLTQNSGGSGTFFYLVGAIKEDKGYRGTAGVLLGDRIAPQTTEFRDGMVIVNYAHRAEGEAMTVPSSVGKSMYLKYDQPARNFVAAGPTVSPDGKLLNYAEGSRPRNERYKFVPEGVAIEWDEPSDPSAVVRYRVEFGGPIMYRLAGETDDSHFLVPFTPDESICSMSVRITPLDRQGALMLPAYITSITRKVRDTDCGPQR